MQDLIVHAIQEDLIWENEQANLQLFEQRISEIGESDLILLPEMFNTGFTMNPGANANPEPGPVLDWMMDQAHKADSAICGSTIVRVNEEYFNRLYWCRPDGSHEFYDKRHLFSLAGEEKVYSAGNSIIQTEIKGWNIRPLICTTFASLSGAGTIANMTCFYLWRTGLSEGSPIGTNYLLQEPLRTRHMS